VAEDARSSEKLALAQRHLERVQSAWDDPTDWDDLALYGFYCLEGKKAAVAGELHRKHGLPDIEQLLRDLNDARKSAAYGDIPAPDLNAEHVASEIETYVDAVAELVERTSGDGE
jgi:hypothetical protein